MSTFKTENAGWYKDIHDIIESWSHGQTFTKFIAKDDGSDDFTVEIHGLITENAELVIVSERVIKKERSK